MELIELFCIICFTALCTAIDESEIPVPSVALQTPWSAVFTSESVELKCSMQVSPDLWTYTWYRGGQEVVQGAGVSFGSEGSDLTISPVRPEHAGQYTCTGQLMGRTVKSEPSKAQSLEVKEIPVPSVALQTPWSAVFTSESVELKCSMQVSPDLWTYTWYRGGQEVVQGAGVSFGSEGSDLTISPVRPEHAGQYTCTGQLMGRTVKSEPSKAQSLEVKEIPVPSVALQTPWSAVFTSESVELKCSMEDSPDLWTYTWYRGGQEVVHGAGSDLTISPVRPEHAGQYTCTGQLMGRTVKSEPSKAQSLEVKEIPVPSVALQTPWSAVFTSESVELKCSMEDSPDLWTYTWYRGGQEVVQGAGVSFGSEGSVLTISPVRPEHAGQYTCTGQLMGRTVKSEPSKAQSLEVKEIPVPSVALQTPWSAVFTSESVELKCSMQDSPDLWTYTWYRGGQEVVQGAGVSFGSEGSVLTISPVRPEHAGQYTCTGQLMGRTVKSEPSKAQSLEVKEIPVPSVALQTPWSAVFTSESVELKCSMEDSPDLWTYTWYRGGQEVVQGAGVSFGSEGSVLTISPVRPEHAGQYTCTGQLKGRPVKSEPSKAQSLEVKEIPVPSVALQTPWSAVFTSESVELKCSMEDSPDLWTYTWYRGGQEVVQGAGVSFGSEGSVLTISPVRPEHAGQYTCTGQLMGRTVKSEPSKAQSLEVKEIPVPSVALQTPWSAVFTSESVELKCSMEDSPDLWTYTWYRGGQAVVQGAGVSFGSEGSDLTISPVRPEHAGQYTCTGQLMGRTVKSEPCKAQSLEVKEIPVPSVALQTPWSAVFTSESVELKCSMEDSPDLWTYTWYRGGQAVVQGAGVSFGSEGSDLTISPVRPEHAGQYTCTGQLMGRPVKSEHSKPQSLEVKEIPVPSVALQTPWSAVFTSESVELKCSMQDSPDLWTYTWYRGGQEVVQGAGVSFGSEGSVLTIRPVRPEHAGQYTCTGQLKGRPVKSEPSKPQSLEVKEIPVPSVALQTPWPDVFPSEKAEMNCKMQDSPGDWTYTWYRGGQKMAVQEPGVSFGSDGSQLVISSARQEHEGEYNCTGQLKGRVTSEHSKPLSLSVYDKKPTPLLIQDPGHRKMYAKESIKFSCKVSTSSGWEFHWFKDSVKLPNQGENYTIPSASSVNAGAHRCHATRAQEPPFTTEDSNTISISVEVRPRAKVTLLTGWSEVFSADRLDLKCEVHGSEDTWNYTWFGGSEQSPLSFNAKHPVMSKDVNQSHYSCMGNRSSRPLYSQRSEPFKTTNLLLKRRVLLSISGCLFFGIIAVFIGCIVMRITRKPVTSEDKPEEVNLFLTRAELQASDVAPCPLAEYVSDEEKPALTKDAEDIDTVCHESTPLPLSFSEVEAETSETNGGLKSFKY
ncbi:hemicentin-1-like [Gadus macrocephalus]|uniref:hemicentin-1-like n=1 Tax=Gadus macrocephalus TaxID=80720 RepID=UPI0028CB1F7A|nr:hemicentin-1-like [Gadus macrocephalus]